MKILLVTYEFPPSRSPRALRWRYLSRELALLGHEVHVLVPDLGEPDCDFPGAPGKVCVHPVFPGLLGMLVRRSRRRRRGAIASGPIGADSPQGSGVNAIGLNWKGRLVESIKWLGSWLLFPDLRAEWSPWARPALRRLIAALSPDVVITSHEPASVLPLGLLARREGIPWIADLGDPVYAPYTPRRWQRRALRLEADVCAHADRITVTTSLTTDLLAERHGLDRGRCVVIPNGYDDRLELGQVEGLPCTFDNGRLELLFAGRLYGFRDPTPLFKAVAATPGVRLTMVVPDPPTGYQAAINAVSASGIRFVGSQSHAVVRAMMERADILVNIGNQGLAAQVPAKLYEFFGIRRPILQLDAGGCDPASLLLRTVNRGWVCNNQEQDVRALLQRLVDARSQERRLDDGLDLAPLAEYAHSSLARALVRVLRQAVRARP